MSECAFFRVAAASSEIKSGDSAEGAFAPLESNVKVQQDETAYTFTKLKQLLNKVLRRKKAWKRKQNSMNGMYPSAQG